MTDPKSHAWTATLIISFSLALQIAFAAELLGPAWLSPILSLPALGALIWLWQRAKQQHASLQAFNKLVI